MRPKRKFELQRKQFLYWWNGLIKCLSVCLCVDACVLSSMVIMSIQSPLPGLELTITPLRYQALIQKALQPKKEINNIFFLNRSFSFFFVSSARSYSTLQLFYSKQHKAPVKPWRKQVDTISWSIMPSPYWREDRNIKSLLIPLPHRQNDIWTSIHGPHSSNVTVKAILISTQIKDPTGSNLNIQAEVSRPNCEWCLSPHIIMPKIGISDRQTYPVITPHICSVSFWDADIFLPTANFGKKKWGIYSATKWILN